ncbi:Protein tyrosine kinase [Dirofilaria immitis]|nr:Protein tyrosine kinase [Dirofilaria immitis]
MRSCWAHEPSLRPNFGTIRQKLASQLEDITEQYSYLKLDNQRDYYNITYDTDISKDDKEMKKNDSPAEVPEVEKLRRIMIHSIMLLQQISRKIAMINFQHYHVVLWIEISSIIGCSR